MFFQVHDFLVRALRLSLGGLSLSGLSSFFPFLFFDLGLPVMYARFESVVVSRWRSASALPRGNAKEDTWKCAVRICFDYLIATATVTTLELSLQILFLISGVPTPTPPPMLQACSIHLKHLQQTWPRASVRRHMGHDNLCQPTSDIASFM